MSPTGSPEWFYEKSNTAEMDEWNTTIENKREKFIKRFSPQRLMSMTGYELLQSVFSDDPASMMRWLMFDRNYREFGAAGQYKYLGIIYQNNTTWKYKEGANSESLSEKEAIEKAKYICDQLVRCADEIENSEVLETIHDYQDLQNRMEKVFFYKYPWAIKYYQMLFPQYFPGMYADKTIERALYVLGLPNHGRNNRLINAGEISLFIRLCDVNNIVFNRIYGTEWGWNNEVSPCENAEINYENSSQPVRHINLRYYKAYVDVKKETDKKEKEIISFPCAGTYEVVRESLIHAHPVKRGFPTKTPKYLMVRGNGGVSHELFMVKHTMEFNPYDDKFISSVTNSDYQNRIHKYIDTRKAGFGFEYASEAYRFYVLETVYRYNPPFILTNNTQGYRYLSFSQARLTDSDIQTIELRQLEEELDRLDVPETDRMSLIKTRINQGLFREKLLQRYGKCCLCGVSCSDLLTASHIKPWSESDNNERLDTDNGFLLCPNHDRLFDRGFITFDDDGRIMICKELEETNRIFLNVRYDMKINLTKGNRDYLKYHREKVYRDSEKQ